MQQSLAEYRTNLIFEALKQNGRTRFESVIDLGCDGNGSILRELIEKVGAKTATGIDQGIHEESKGPVVLQRANILEYVPTKEYDLVISNQVFEHIYEPWLPKYFKVLKASCSRNGIVLISTPNRWRPNNIIRRLTFRSPIMMSPNKGVPPEQHLGHHRECSYRELQTMLDGYFQEPEWHVKILRLHPYVRTSYPRWIANILVYFLLWVFWRPFLLSASQDHYVIIQRNPEV